MVAYLCGLSFFNERDWIVYISTYRYSLCHCWQYPLFGKGHFCEADLSVRGGCHHVNDLASGILVSLFRHGRDLGLVEEI